jgi:hypothetical protein
MAPPLLSKSQPVIAQLMADLDAEVKRSQSMIFMDSSVASPAEKDQTPWLADSNSFRIPLVERSTRKSEVTCDAESNVLSTLLKLGELLNLLWETAPQSTLWAEIWEQYQVLKSALSNPNEKSQSLDKSQSLADIRNQSIPATPDANNTFSVQATATPWLSSVFGPTPILPDASLSAELPAAPPPAAPLLEVFVRSTAFKSLRLLLRLSDTVAAVQQRIREHCGLPLDRQRLLFDGRAMAPHTAIGEYSVYRACSFHLVDPRPVPAQALKPPVHRAWYPSAPAAPSPPSRQSVAAAEHHLAQNSPPAASGRRDAERAWPYAGPSGAQPHQQRQRVWGSGGVESGGGHEPGGGGGGNDFNGSGGGLPVTTFVAAAVERGACSSGNGVGGTDGGGGAPIALFPAQPRPTQQPPPLLPPTPPPPLMPQAHFLTPLPAPPPPAAAADVSALSGGKAGGGGGDDDSDLLRSILGIAPPPAAVLL